MIKGIFLVLLLLLPHLPGLLRPLRSILPALIRVRAPESGDVGLETLPWVEEGPTWDPYPPLASAATHFINGGRRDKEILVRCSFLPTASALDLNLVCCFAKKKDISSSPFLGVQLYRETNHATSKY